MKSLLPFLFLAISACGSVTVSITKAAPPRPDDCSLKIIPESEASGSFDVLCILDSKTDAIGMAQNTMERAVSRSKVEACRCGADAILISSGNIDNSTFGRATARIKAVRILEGH